MKEERKTRSGGVRADQEGITGRGELESQVQGEVSGSASVVASALGSGSATGSSLHNRSGINLRLRVKKDKKEKENGLEQRAKKESGRKVEVEDVVTDDGEDLEEDGAGGLTDYEALYGEDATITQPVERNTTQSQTHGFKRDEQENEETISEDEIDIEEDVGDHKAQRQSKKAFVNPPTPTRTLDSPISKSVKEDKKLALSPELNTPVRRTSSRVVKPMLPLKSMQKTGPTIIRKSMKKAREANRLAREMEQKRLRKESLAAGGVSGQKGKYLNGKSNPNQLDKQGHEKIAGLKQVAGMKGNNKPDMSDRSPVVPVNQQDTSKSAVLSRSERLAELLKTGGEEVSKAKSIELDALATEAAAAGAELRAMLGIRDPEPLTSEPSETKTPVAMTSFKPHIPLHATSNGFNETQKRLNARIQSRMTENRILEGRISESRASESRTNESRKRKQSQNAPNNCAKFDWWEAVNKLNRRQMDPAEIAEKAARDFASARAANEALNDRALFAEDTGADMDTGGPMLQLEQHVAADLGPRSKPRRPSAQNGAAEDALKMTVESMKRSEYDALALLSSQLTDWICIIQKKPKPLNPGQNLARFEESLNLEDLT